jgi:hypothetical protein
VFTASLLPHSVARIGRRLASELRRVDGPASSAPTREMLGWQPTNVGLVADLDQGHPFDAPAAR